MTTFDTSMNPPPPPAREKRDRQAVSKGVCHHQAEATKNTRTAFHCLRAKSGVSLIIAIVFVSALMLVMSGLFEAQLFTIQTVKNHELEGKADYLEEGVKEIAGWYAANASLGANVDGTVANPQNQTLTTMLNAIYAMADDMMNSGAVDPNPNAGQAAGFNCSDTTSAPGSAVDPCVGFTIKGHAEVEDQVKLGDVPYYSVPIANTGDAVENAAEYCAEHPSDLAANGSADNPCNWNKLKMGDSVEIPLYYMEGNNNVVKDFTEPANQAPTQKFILRVRAPLCEDVKEANTEAKRDNICLNGARVDLHPAEYDADFLKIGVDKVLIQWTISDADPASNRTLLAMDSRKPPAKIERLRTRIVDGQKVTEANTEISAGRINLAKDHLHDFIILEDKPNIKEYEGKDLDGVGTSIGRFLQDSTKPVLRLQMVDLPYINFNDKSYNVPTLEYQLLTSTPVSDSKSLLKGFAKIGDFNKEFKTYSYRKQTAGGFVLESF